MITLITGLPGAGKTLYALAYVEQLAQREGRTVYYSGVADLRLGWIEMAKPEEWYTVEANSIVVLDEAQRLFRPRGVGAQTPRYVSELETHRHRGIDVVLITQHPKLCDANVRRLIGRHFHVVRTFGMKRATVHEWGELKEDCERSREDSVRHEWSYPVALFNAYKSAEVHTHKARVPARVFLLLAVPLLLALCVFLVARWWSAAPERMKAKDEKKVVAASGQAASGVIGGGKGVGRVSVDEFLTLHRPRVEGLAYTAPVYDDVTKPVRAPYPAACVASNGRCRCYSDQGTGLDMPEALCGQIVERGFYVAWDASRAPSGGAKGVEHGPEPVRPEAVSGARAAQSVELEPSARGSAR